MRVFVAGGTGAIGRQLVPRLVALGHEVVVSTRSPAKLAQVQAWGADGVVMEGLDPVSVASAVTAARPEVVVHQMTALGGISGLTPFRPCVRVHQPTPY
jgi:nucleoside-diphosphate-sugar epimerase